MTTKVVTANRLIDGSVVYLTAEGGWSLRIEDSRIAADEDASARLLAEGERAAAEHVVVAPYLIDVTVEAGTVTPVRFREAIRSRGPTVASDFRAPVSEER